MRCPECGAGRLVTYVSTGTAFCPSCRANGVKPEEGAPFLLRVEEGPGNTTVVQWAQHLEPCHRLWILERLRRDALI